MPTSYMPYAPNRAPLLPPCAAPQMQTLAAAPLPVLTDAKREADGDNPRGYYALEAASRLRRDQA